jgi:hypothetical protein
LIENVSAMRDRRGRARSSCDDAGVIGPYATPITSAAAAEQRRAAARGAAP